MSAQFHLHYKPGTALADRWGEGPLWTYSTREEAEWVLRTCVSAEFMEVVSDE